MDDKQIDLLLADIKIDRERVRKSISAILHMLDLKLADIFVYRKRLEPSQIFVAAVEECNLQDAKRIMEEKYPNTLPAPVTVLEFNKKNVLFMGSNRSVIFVLKGKMPDCVVVEVPDRIQEPMIVSEAKQTLGQVIEKQK